MPENTIDQAITSCENSIKSHKNASQLNLLIMCCVVVLFVLLLSGIADFINKNQNNIDSDLTKESAIVKDLNDKKFWLSNALFDFYRNSYVKKEDSVTKKKVTDAYNETMRKFAEFNEADSGGYVKRFNTYLDRSTIKISQSSTYIFYGIFLFIFGIITSFYRYHLKEISKYEHFLFGLYRIRIAANNKDFPDVITNTLVKDAFSIPESSVLNRKTKKVDSPIPGHPGSDFASAIFNKIADAIDVTIKNKKPGEQ